MNINNLKNIIDNKQNINVDLKSSDLKSNKKDILNNNFKSVLNKVSKVKENKSEYKADGISESNNDLSDNPKAEKKKNTSLNTILMLLFQHLSGEKVDFKNSLEEFKEEGASDDVIQSILNSKQTFSEKVNSLIKMLSQNDTDKDNGLKDILNKLSLLNNEELDENSIKMISKSLEEVNNIGKQDISKNEILQEQIIKTLKSKLFNEDSDNKNVKSTTEKIENSLKTELNSKSLVQNNNETKNENNNETNEEDFLKNLLSRDKSKADNKINRLTTFMNDFNKVNNTLSKDIETEVPVNINKNNLVNDFIKSVKYMEQNNVKEMTVKVMPRELGEIVIRLTVENGLMKANITANNKEAYNLLNSKAQELNNSLGNGEIKIQNFTIDIYNGDTTFFSRENSKEHRNNSNNNTKGRHEGIQALEDIKDNEELLAKELDSNVSAFV
ncbi:flagellar hook-length control protein FliK [Clostridium botulinum C]|uniref:Flagellar hook-length control protein FliK n=2 Tax=Clostridium botulinum TaxID=1491 RepID=A0A9Q4TMU9_CLOBO|nr:flagellar hook-length control protein FliK [Clostridium botulinum]EGO86959.1 flagellar hook-length control protein [Clostridium botulinum C str. Stockholm]MCD3194106.1 flagellar hook-length control protein FliK [Clostridium botulinum C]MCD3199265.1 flagellar hook-length control protein FliK [Clostridium botulinum C]MCD3204740.1 flagellar hook-length control protein FliK [Clostridium botulinum C]MCD3208083.1 flagellar hook-length control protein FliK [Clostridium botulinum C]